MNQPLVSIGMPAYNSEKTIAVALQSILKQDYPNFTITVIDNCSTDNTPSIITNTLGKQGNFIQHSKNIGVIENFTQCCSIATGKYTGIYHSDDIYYPNIISKQVKFLEDHPDVGIVFSGAHLINEMGERIGEVNLNFLPKDWVILDGPALLKLVLRHNNFLICPSAMVRTSIYQDELKEWRLLFGSAADLDTWFRIASCHKVAIINEPLMQLRLSKTQCSYTADRVRTVRGPFLSVLEHHYEQPAIKNHMSRKDRDYLKILEIADMARRCLNLLIFGKYPDIKILLKSFWKLSNVRLFFLNNRAMKSFLLMMVITVGNFLPLKKITRKTAKKIFSK